MKKNSVVAHASGKLDPIEQERTYNEELKSNFQDSKTVNNDSTINNDAWQNMLTGLGTCGRDKKENAFFRLTKIFNRSELDQMYRSDGNVRLIIDLFAQEMIRQGWELEGDAEGRIVNKLEELKANEAISNLIKWARLYGGGICI